MHLLSNNEEGISKSRYVVAIGDANLDIAVTSIFPVRQHVTLPCKGVHYKSGGGPRNVAENLARLGCDTRLISVFGDDRYGHELMQATRQAGVDIQSSRVCPERVTGIYLIINNPDGENYCTIGDPSNVEALTPEWLETQHALLQNAALIVANPTLSPDALAWLMNHQHACPIFMDTVSFHYAERIAPYLSQIHTLKPNRAEASQLSGLPFASRKDAPAIAQWFHHAGVAHIILSMGEYGLYYSDGEQADWLAPLPVAPIVNVTGAGDALMAGLAYGHLNALPFVDSVHFALASAALTLTTEENNHPNLSADLVRELLQNTASTRISPSGQIY